MKKKDNGFDLKYWQMFDISLFGRGQDEVLKIIQGWLGSQARKKWIATVNPEFVMKATKDDQFRELLKKTDLNVVDGVGLIWAKQLADYPKFSLKKLSQGIKTGVEIIQGKHKEGLVTGVDLMSGLSELAAKNKYKVFFLGGFGDRAKRTAQYFEAKNKGLITEYSAGEPSIKNEDVIKQINKFKPDILFVAYGMKKQEEWIWQNRDKMGFGVAIGVGRSFDYYSGDLKRAPKAWRRMGMEWLYSLIKEPKRFKRQLVLPKFMWKVLTD